MSTQLETTPPRLRTLDFGPRTSLGLRTLSVLLALIGYWTPWLTHRAAALRLNGYELSEWVTFLPGVRDGSLPFNRLAFLIPLACLALLLGIAASRFRPTAPSPSSWLRAKWPRSVIGWVLLGLAVLCCYTVFPPYPYIFRAYADPEFQLQFFVALATLFGLILTLYLPVGLNTVLQILLAGLGGAYGWWTLLAVRPVASALLNAPWAIGLGWFVMLAGFVGLIISGVSYFFSPAF